MTRIALEATYASGTGQQQYRFTVGVNAADVVVVREITSPFGLIMDSYTSVPKPVVTDINAAIAQMENLLSLTSAVSGTVTFSSATDMSVTFATAMADTNYRVHLSPSDFVAVRVTNKLTTGFTIQANITFTGTVGYDVFV